jgi:CRP-like cAMP-binding protein
MSIDFEEFKKIYGLNNDASTEEIASFFNVCEIKDYKKKQKLIEAGTKTNLAFYVIKGLVGKFIFRENGDKILYEIYAENYIIFNSSLILNEGASNFFFEAMEKTTVLAGDFEYFDKLAKTEFATLNQQREFIYRKLFKDAHDRIETLIILEPEERVKNFMENNPELINRVPDKHIASLLGLHPVSLSRIKKRILNNGN